METFFIKFATVTYAQKAQKALDRAGILSRMAKTGKDGCGYGLNITASSRTEALRILKKAGIQYSI